MAKNKEKYAQFPRNCFFSVFSYEMKKERKDAEKRGDSWDRTFSLRGVYWRMGVLMVLFLADLVVQAYWVVSSHNIGYDPWWISMFGLYSGSWDYPVLAFIISILGFSPALGMALFIPACIFSQFKWIFGASVSCILFGMARWFGRAVGKAILFAQVKSGRLENGTFYSDDPTRPWKELHESDTMFHYWPGVVFGVILVAAALVFAFKSNFHGALLPRFLGGAATLSSVGLIGILIVQRGLSGLGLGVVCIVGAGAMGLLFIPKEVTAMRATEERRYAPSWEWHAASILLLEALLMFSLIAASAS